MSRPSMVPALLLTLCLGACAQAPMSATASPQPVADPASPVHCDAGKVVDAIGRLPQDEVVEAARKAAGAEVVRTLRQGQPITKEFRVGRLNLVLDAEGRIASANCG